MALFNQPVELTYAFRAARPIERGAAPGVLKVVAEKVIAWVCRQKTQRAFQAMSERMLNDIGFTRYEVPHAALSLACNVR